MHATHPVAALLLAWSCLAVFRFPHGALWTSTIAATEFGHFLALLGIGVGIWAWSAGAWVGVVMAIGAVALFLSPHVRAASLQAGYEPSGLIDMAAEASGEVTTHVYPAADGSELALDLYPGLGSGPHPLMLSIHGGSWTGGDRTQLAGFNRHLAALGYTVAAISYRLAPDHRHPAQIEDVEAALAWLLDHAVELELDGAPPVVFGRSAGGHLAMMLGARAGRQRVRGVIAFYPPADLVWGWANPQPERVYASRDTLRAFIGAGYDDAPERFADASPVTHVGPETPPILTVHGARDEFVSLTHARHMAAAVEKAGSGPYEVVVLPWATHGFDANPAGPGAQIAWAAIDRFLASLE